MDTHSTREELSRLEDRRCQAMIAADVATLADLFSDDLTWTHSSARQDTKKSFLEALQAGGTRYLEIKRSEERILLHDDVAVITGVVGMRAIVKGDEKSLRNRYTNVWVSRDGRWRMVAWQSTVVPPQ